MDVPTNKKRKLSRLHEEDSDNEEDKIEKFFAIIRSIQEARDRLLNGTSSSSSSSSVFGTSKDINKKRMVEEKEGFGWKPSFEREDFVLYKEKQGGGGGGGGGSGGEARKQEGDMAASPPVVVVEKDEYKEEMNLRLSL